MPTTDTLNQVRDETFAYLTTTGRTTGQPHRIEIWFGAEGGRIFLMSGGRDRSDWVKNIRTNAAVSIDIADHTFTGQAQIVAPDEPDDALARTLLVEKYRKGDNLVDWGRNSLPVVIDIDADERTRLGIQIG